MSRYTIFLLRILTMLLLVACVLGSAARASGPAAAPGVGIFDVDSLLMDYPLAPDQSMRTDQIAHDSLSSVHLTQIRGSIESHRHLSHDENVWVIRGAGRLTMDGVRHKVAAGQVIHIPKGVPHSFHNMGSHPTVVISIFSPGFDGKDRIYDNPPPR